jgi:hypothetical protein
MQHCRVILQDISIEPYSSKSVSIVYIPSSLNTLEEGTITFSSPGTLHCIYNVKGKGKLPTNMDTTEIYSPLNTRSPHFIHFTNPFSTPMTISSNIHNSTSNNENVFQLEGPMDIDLAPFESVDINYYFEPKDVDCIYKCFLTIRGSEIEWTYPIHGMAEVEGISSSIEVVATARTKETKLVEFTLPGTKINDTEYGGKLKDLFSVHVEVLEGENAFAAERAFTFHLKDVQVERGGVKALGELIFVPFRPFQQANSNYHFFPL